jgi:hypothetical protein
MSKITISQSNRTLPGARKVSLARARALFRARPMETPPEPGHAPEEVS